VWLVSSPLSLTASVDALCTDQTVHFGVRSALQILAWFISGSDHLYKFWRSEHPQVRLDGAEQASEFPPWATARHAR
jgi:hypothetical protein